MSIELYNICKTFEVKGRKIEALRDITLRIKEGSFVGLLGPNGAGKTTLTRILATLLLPDKGEGYIDGIPLYKEKKIREIIGTVFGESGGRSLYYRLSVYDNLLFFSTLAGVPKKEAKRRINALLDYFDLSSKKNTLVMKLSTGMKAKVLLIRALIPSPRVLLLDEPTLGFDLISFEKAKQLLAALNKRYSTTILLTSHNFTELEDMTERLILIDNGRIIDNCSQEHFKQVYSKKTIELTLKLDYADPFFIKKQILDTLPVRIVFSDYMNERTLKLKLQPLEDSVEEIISRVIILLIDNGVEILEVKPHVPSLREAFLAFLAIKNKEKDTRTVDEQLEILVER